MITLELSQRLFSKKFFPYLQDYSHRFEMYYGGAGSGKSYFIAQKLIIRACSEEGIRIMVCRRYATTLRETVWSLFKEVLEKWKIINYCKINDSNFTISFPNKSKIIFQGLDAETKLLSLNDISTIFVEEVWECTESIVEQLNLRMRSTRLNQQIIMAWNPISKQHWLYKWVQTPPENSLVIHSIYKDNPWLSKEYVESLEQLRQRNPAKARIYCDGEWGVEVDGLIYRNWVVQSFDPVELGKTLQRRCGADFGYIDPSVLIDCLYDKDNKIIYIFNEFYQSGCQLDDIYNAIVRMKMNKSLIYMDSAEPRSIDYLKSKGINAKPSIKGQDSVKAGILFIQNHQLIISPSCQRTIDALENYAYERDKQTGLFVEKPCHDFSHIPDAIRYAFSDMITRKPMRTIDKSILGL